LWQREKARVAGLDAADVEMGREGHGGGGVHQGLRRRRRLVCKTLRGSLLRRRRKECFKDRKSKDGYKIIIISDVVSAIKDF
jgi:hypothetical protein